jgi:hypothetical protein
VVQVTVVDETVEIAVADSVPNVTVLTAEKPAPVMVTGVAALGGPVVGVMPVM